MQPYLAKSRSAVSPLTGAYGGRSIVLRDQEPCAPFKQPEHIKQIIRARRLRDEIFGAELFADPAWDILLDAFLAHLEQRRVSVSHLCDAASVPATTALRWLSTLEQQGYLTREPDRYDGRRTWIRLSEKGIEALENYAAHLLNRPVI